MSNDRRAMDTQILKYSGRDRERFYHTILTWEIFSTWKEFWFHTYIEYIWCCARPIVTIFHFKLIFPSLQKGGGLACGPRFSILMLFQRTFFWNKKLKVLVLKGLIKDLKVFLVQIPDLSQITSRSNKKKSVRLWVYCKNLTFPPACLFPVVHICPRSKAKSLSEYF